MQITSLSFVLFVVAALAVHYLLPGRFQNYWLLLASYLFYWTWAWQFVLVLIVLTAVNYALAHALHRADRQRRAILWVGIAFNVLVLAFFKYADFYLPHMLDLLSRAGVQVGAGGVRILLPVGLSFLVMQTISYLIDVSHRQMAPVSNFFDFALYLAYFPKLVSGPIERARSFLPRLAEPRVVDNAALARSFTLIVVGLVRKLAIADPLAGLIPLGIFQTPPRSGWVALATWLLAYGFSLYNDFAGYTNIARGVSGLFGIDLSPNFQQPFFARNFTELWGRWHMSLSQWLRDYVFFPVSRAMLRRFPNRRNLLNLLLPPLVTMFVSALWHGASWHMLLWGTMQGLYLALDRLPTLWRPVVPPDRQPVWRQGAGMLLVNALFALSLVPFHTGVGPSLAYWRELLGLTRIGQPDGRILLLIGVTLLLDGLQYRHRDETAFLRWPRPAQAALLAFAVLSIFLITRADASAVPFIYQGF